MMKIKNLIFIALCLFSSLSSIYAQPSPQTQRDQLIDKLANTSPFLKKSEPSFTTEEELRQKVAESTQKIKLKEPISLPDAYWQTYEEIAYAIQNDIKNNIPKDVHLQSRLDYMQQLASTSTENLEALSEDANFENTDLFDSIVDLKKIFINQEKTKIQRTIESAENYLTNLEKLDRQFGKQNFPK